jgi:hypothetical protein
MGTWGAGIFMDDQACDVRDQYLDGLADGTDEDELVDGLIEELGNDVDDYPVGILALAATQYKYGRLRDDVKSRALEVIKSGADLARWEDSDVARRRAALAALKRKLESPQPSRTLPRRRSNAPLTVESDPVWSPDGSTGVYVWKSVKPDPNTPVFCQACLSFPSGGSGVVAAHCEMEEVDLEWTDHNRLLITLPEGCEEQRAVGWSTDSDVHVFPHFGQMTEVTIRYRTSGPQPADGTRK